MRTGFTCSTFDLLHAGHIIMLEEAKRNCDYLIVGLQVDPTLDRPDTKNRPVQSIVERQIQLEGCQYIDYIIVYQSEQDLMDILTICNIDVRFLGEDYIDKDFTGKQYCIDNGIEIYYNKRKHRFSTTELRQRAGLPKTDI
jgi:glycerol-3-phosphate cytidylyltransferase